MNAKQVERARQRQKLVAKVLQLHKQGVSSHAMQYHGISIATAHRIIKKFPSAELPLEYYSDGYKEPLPLPTRIEIAEREYQQAKENVSELKGKLKKLGHAYRWSKKCCEEARLELVQLLEAQ